MNTGRDLLEALREQLDFLESSIRLFDDGHQNEALRLAVTLRVLLYGRGGTPLLGQLSVLESVDWFSFGAAVDPANLSPTNALVVPYAALSPAGVYGDFESKATAPHSEAQHCWLPFKEWWESVVIHNPRMGRSFTRCDLVQMLANRDGGAHLAPLKPHERRLKRNELTPFSVGSSDEFDVVEKSPAHPSVRTIASEVIITLQRNRDMIGF